MLPEDIANRFAFHAATTTEKRDEHTSVRFACRQLADKLNASLPEGREKSLAVSSKRSCSGPTPPSHGTTRWTMAETFMEAADSARRASDAVNFHLLAIGHAAIGKWVAIRLQDGSSDGVLYDKRAEAIKHQLHETTCAYVCIPPNGMPPEDAMVYLREMRRLYDRGYRLADPDQSIIA